ncbi:ROK family transcriptional regulator [Thermobispora bispora]|uniref:ROK family protein n=1 Tax=Thermobispora bispora (strain ATCC 19993 / DSM 43833 / CBS 139.67 / JCM 10125 / KCTC 9307 / NBRC 14880 / R51) TaxID=469371 RepID=D6Y2S0_THEBD|nr:ROK family transcriptional regulator [Thermobispora bispora]ADG86881.1 ROK family protein [Thermobispora bispora DSM 43833]
MKRAIRHDAMRARNLALVLGELSARGSLTRAALAEITGLTKTTVSKLVSDLIEAGLVTEAGPVRDGERGRPGVEVQVSGDRVAALGLEVNVDYLALRVVDLAHTVRLRRTQAVDNRGADPVEVIGSLRTMALSAVDEAVDMGLRVVGGGLAVPGPVDATGTVYNAPNLGWREVPVAGLLDLPFPVRVENEANLAALGELWFGTGLPDFVYVSGEIGIGAGVVVQGRLFRGTHGFAGELGHVVVRPEGPPCRCGGRGCLERYAGQEALLAAAGITGPGDAHRPGSAHGPSTAQGSSIGRGSNTAHGSGSAQGSNTAHGPGIGQGSSTAQGPGTAEGPGTTEGPGSAHGPDTAQGLDVTAEAPAAGVRDLLARLEAGDEAALAACEQAGAALGVALCSAVNLLDPDAIVLGGIYAPLFPWLAEPVTEALTTRLGRMRPTVPPVVVSRLGTEAAALGAAGQVIEQVIADPAALLSG